MIYAASAPIRTATYDCNFAYSALALRVMRTRAVPELGRFYGDCQSSGRSPGC